jgi:hypothetical protein
MSQIYRGPDFREDNRSNAEHDILIALQRRRLNLHFYTQYPYHFSTPQDITPYTSIDFYWKRPGLTHIAMFLDGEHVHRSTHQRTKDMQIDEQLKRRGVLVHRFTYRAPLSKTRCRDIVGQIERVLKANGY